MVQKFAAALAATCLLAGFAQAGQVSETGYQAERFAGLSVTPPPGKWEIRDRETSPANANEYGGPVVDFLYKLPMGDTYPVVQVSAVKKADASVTPEFVLQTGRDAMAQQGGQMTPVAADELAGRKVWRYEAVVGIKGQSFLVRYLLLEGANAFYQAQMVTPTSAAEEAKTVFDGLLSTFRY